jgi:hypothetical protein
LTSLTNNGTIKGHNKKRGFMIPIKTAIELNKLADRLGLKISNYTDIASKSNQQELLQRFDFYYIPIKNYFIIIKCKKNTKQMISFYKNEDYYSRIRNDLETTLKKHKISYDFYN